jgi:hypothetical protein
MASMRDTAALHQLLVSRFPDLAHVPRDFYIVGGAVRDLLLGEHPLDVDLTGIDSETAARQFARRTGGRTIELGRDPLRVHRVFARGRIYDFADLQRGSIDADLGRRDFTIDALAYRADEQRLYDFHGGVEDLNRRVIRMITEQNLLDDPLRILKAVRMAVRLDFVIEPETAEAIRRHARRIADVAPERVTYELDGILTSGRARDGIALLRALGLDLFGGSIAGPGDTNDPDITLALLLRDRTEEDVRRLGERWRWSAARIQAIVAFLRSRGDRRPLRIAIYDAGRMLAPRIAVFLHQASDERAGAFSETLAGDGTAIFATQAMLDGEEIGSIAGIETGPRIGVLKRSLLEAQLLGEVRTSEDAVEFVRSHRGGGGS